mmetsp:Transcript_18090/g.20856  ORF Transcript_18090/g.20856 Transcript_18090/m.20856 type:complete len:111 (+) Transcript_18090:177-509(+)
MPCYAFSELLAPFFDCNTSREKKIEQQKTTYPGCRAEITGEDDKLLFKLIQLKTTSNPYDEALFRRTRSDDSSLYSYSLHSSSSDDSEYYSIIDSSSSNNTNKEDYTKLS